jgi:hypothetical protein
MAIIKEHRKVLNEKQFKKEAYYLNAISFSIFDDVIPGSLKKSPKKSTQKKPTAPAKSVPGAIPALSFDLTSTLATISSVAKELEATTLKPPIITPELSTVVPRTVPTTTHSGRTVKRYSG